jgi:hypothetical protein
MKKLLRATRLAAAGLLLSCGFPAPSAVAAPTGQLVETTHEGCSEVHLDYLDASGHWVDIPIGESRTFTAKNGVLSWKCGGTSERTGCPGETRSVTVTRGWGSPFTVQCFAAPRSDGATVLETTYEACSSDRLIIVGAHGGVTIHYTKSGTVDVASNDVTWYCDETRERTGCPHGTNAVGIVRNGDREFEVDCLRKK